MGHGSARAGLFYPNTVFHHEVLALHCINAMTILKTIVPGVQVFRILKAHGKACKIDAPSQQSIQRLRRSVPRYFGPVRHASEDSCSEEFDR